MRYGFLKYIICVKKRIMHYITEFELDLIISNSYWKFVRKIEGGFDSSNAICTVSQYETLFHDAYGRPSTTRYTIDKFGRLEIRTNNSS